ncbi:hypothetical protein SSS_07430 [Sarcoptes scabiei]|uniref:Ig-like domain-containing protein n=1 Tax=Sarcoptes scabiei TaxID=52283 RepID=A0A834RDY7_SARSC|nr:hypothetical protein SSS_07430 [Sarcoptes scabiei]
MLLLIIFILNLFESCSGQESPKIIDFVPKISQPIGSNLVLTCNVINIQEPLQFDWHKNGQNIDKLSQIERSRFSIDNRRGFSIFNLIDLNQNDSGNYTCVVRNSFGSAQQSTILLVKGLLIPMIKIP